MPKFMPYGRRKHRRAAKKALKKRNKRLLKTYNYKFKLPQQILAASQSTTGLLQVVNSGTGTNPGPLLQTGVFNKASITGFTGMYDSGLAVTFKLSDCENFSKYVALYDAYKINSVTLELEWLNNVAAVNGSGLCPTAYLVLDQDSSTTPGSINDVAGYQGVIRKCFGSGSSDRRMKFTMRPYVSVGVENTIGGTTAHAIVQKSPWIDCISTDVPHYAMKAWLTDLYVPGNNNSQNGFRLQWTYDITFRSPIQAT